jgi:hypothetical protein
MCGVAVAGRLVGTGRGEAPGFAHGRARSGLPHGCRSMAFRVEYLQVCQ